MLIIGLFKISLLGIGKIDLYNSDFSWLITQYEQNTF
jgi:hypothetical protein